MNRNLWFTSTNFKVLPNEEEETNPGRFGKALATWIRERLNSRGRGVTEAVIPEDFGWVVMVQRAPYALWVGCGNEDDSKTKWCLFVAAEPSFFQRLFKRVDPEPEVAALEMELEAIVREDSSCKDIAWEELSGRA